MGFIGVVTEEIFFGIRDTSLGTEAMGENCQSSIARDSHLAGVGGGGAVAIVRSNVQEW